MASSHGEPALKTKEKIVFIGAHTILYSRRAEEVRAFLRDVLQLDAIEIGQGWLIFALPPAELAVHPDDGATRHELYLLCDDIAATVQQLEAARGCQPAATFRGGVQQGALQGTLAAAVGAGARQPARLAS
jgi:hypothetical protein